MAAQIQKPDADLFDSYFRRADLDRDGRISGPEAVGFFQGSGLPKPVLAQIWIHADQNKIGFLGRAEFYNALKLLTVAQIRRELTPDIVKAALYGPASAKIPAPQINLDVVSAPPSTTGTPSPAIQMGTSAPPSSQNLGFRGPQVAPNEWVCSRLFFAPTFSAGSLPVSSDIVTISAGTQLSVKPSPPDSLQSSLAMLPGGGQLQPTHSLMKQNQHISTQSTSTYTSSGISLGPENPASSHSHIPWQTITQSDVQKYTKVFLEVDTDRDGKITGVQACNLFLSWRLPREVLKQVWDLSDEDNDSMLSLKEFCIALYLMERYREGRPLPAVLPSSVMSNFPILGQPATGYGNSAWGLTSGWQQQQRTSGSGAQPCSWSSQLPVSPPQVDEQMQTKQPKSKVPILEKHLVDQLNKEEQEALNSKFLEATKADKKVEELEKEILDSKEKIEFYRSKMQELVLYKNRCDNRINEIIERVSGDKHEVEFLAKYEAKCKQVVDVASKLTIEEATFRDVQERKMELYQAIVKMEQDGTGDGILQVCVDRVQSELDELLKALNDRCKKYGLRVKPIALVELPFDSLLSGGKNYDEPTWGTFETNDEVDSVWGFNAVSTATDMDHERHINNDFFGPGEFGLNLIRTKSPRADVFYQKRSPFFDDSVPSTPSGYSPRYSQGENTPSRASQSLILSAHMTVDFPAS